MPITSLTSYLNTTSFGDTNASTRNQQELALTLDSAARQLADWKGLAFMSAGGGAFEVGKLLATTFFSAVPVLSAIPLLTNTFTFVSGVTADTAFTTFLSQIFGEAGENDTPFWQQVLDQGSVRGMGLLGAGQGFAVMQLLTGLASVSGGMLCEEKSSKGPAKGTFLDSLIQGLRCNLGSGAFGVLSGGVLGAVEQRISLKTRNMNNVGANLVFAQNKGRSPSTQLAGRQGSPLQNFGKTISENVEKLFAKLTPHPATGNLNGNVRLFKQNSSRAKPLGNPNLLAEATNPAGSTSPNETSRLESRLQEFTPNRLSVDWRSGPPYAIPPEVDVERTLRMAQGGEREKINRQFFSPEQLRDPKTRVLWSTAPESDFTRSFEVDGVTHRDLMADVMASMTGIANPPELTLSSLAPNYPRTFLEANMPARRIHFESPKVMEDFERAVLEHRPEVVLLSGLNVNTRALLRMALFARKNGAKEVWLGGDAALGPYKILDEVFDRVIWGPAEQYLYHTFVGDDFPGHRHPAVDQMLAGVDWVVTGKDGLPQRVTAQTLHMVLRMGCTQNCCYCAEGIKSDRGNARPPTPIEEAKSLIDEAHAKGIRRVYFIDPDFGRLWQDGLEGEVLRHLTSKGMRWSCLTNVVTLQRHGDFMLEQGLASVYLGIESLSPDHASAEDGRGNRLRVLNRAWQDQSETARQIQRLKDSGVMVFGLYILYNPGETKEGIQEGLTRLQSLVPLSQISTNQPFPGTAEFETAVQSRWIFNYDPDSVRYGQMVWTPNGIVFDPREVSRTYVAAHQAVNDLRRPHGFLETQQALKATRASRSS